MTPTIEFSASLLAANPLQLHNAITSMIAAGIYHAHYDIMDMHYVNNLGLNIQTLSAIHQQFPKLTIDLHYMVKNIDHALAHTQLNPQIRTIYFHPAAAKQPEETIQNIHSAGIAAGIAINPTDAPTHYTHPHTFHCELDLAGRGLIYSHGRGGARPHSARPSVSSSSARSGSTWCQHGAALA